MEAFADVEMDPRGTFRCDLCDGGQNLLPLLACSSCNFSASENEYFETESNSTGSDFKVAS